jgi:hypothetical protein
MSSLQARLSDAQLTVCAKYDHGLTADRVMQHEIATAVPCIAARGIETCVSVLRVDV